jgi:glycosyltransferase involved in cell wall biosynthesis
VRIDQLLPSLSGHDAIGNHALRLRSALRDAGYLSDIYAEHISPGLEGDAAPPKDCPRRPDPDRVLVYHASTESSMVRWLKHSAAQGQLLAIDYHNITPSPYFTRWDPAASKRAKRARAQLAALADVTALALADSGYNQAELATLGFDDPVVSPLLIDVSPFSPSARPSTNEGAAGRWLFVGRIAPNKCHHDLIAAFAVYRKLFDPRAQLSLVGWNATATYRSALDGLTASLELQDAVSWREAISLTDLVAEYQQAEVFVCLSEHEGFCVPLIEAMSAGVPVVAYRAAAIGDTVGSAGVLLGDKDPVVVACAVRELITTPARRAELVAAGRERAAAFTVEASAAHFISTLETRLPVTP